MEMLLKKLTARVLRSGVIKVARNMDELVMKLVMLLVFLITFINCLIVPTPEACAKLVDFHRHCSESESVRAVGKQSCMHGM